MAVDTGGLRSAGASAGRAAGTLLSPRGLAGAAVETAWSAAHLAVYPFGLLRERGPRDGGYGTDRLRLVQRGLLLGDVEASGTPILLVHGLGGNRSIFALLRRGLRRRGFRTVVALNYSLTTNDVRSAAALLAQEVERVLEGTGHDRVHVVAHSLGGLIARYYVQRLGGDERVDTLVTMGTPHAGTRTAYLLPTRLARQLRPGSDLVVELDEPAPDCTTRFVCWWSDLDQLMSPVTTAALHHPDLDVENHLVRGVGHMSLPIQGGIVHAISTTLAHLDGQRETGSGPSAA